MSTMSRRDLLRTAGVGLAGTAATGLVAAQNHAGHGAPEAMPSTPAASTRPSAGGGGRVRTLNGWTLPYRMNGGVKEFHLVAEEFEHEFAPGSKAICWGYNGSTPGPTIEAIEGDHVRIFVTNRLKEATTIHWHGLILPSGMDGVGGFPSRKSALARPTSTSSRCSSKARTCTTRTPMKWCSLQWA